MVKRWMYGAVSLESGPAGSQASIATTDRRLRPIHAVLAVRMGTTECGGDSVGAGLWTATQGSLAMMPSRQNSGVAARIKCPIM